MIGQSYLDKALHDRATSKEEIHDRATLHRGLYMIEQLESTVRRDT